MPPPRSFEHSICDACCFLQCLAPSQLRPRNTKERDQLRGSLNFVLVPAKPGAPVLRSDRLGGLKFSFPFVVPFGTQPPSAGKAIRVCLPPESPVRGQDLHASGAFPIRRCVEPTDPSRDTCCSKARQQKAGRYVMLCCVTSFWFCRG